MKWHIEISLAQLLLRIVTIALLCMAIPSGRAQQTNSRPTIDRLSASPAQVVVAMERFRTCRSCPGYQVFVFDDGTVTYVGKEFVNIAGTQNSRLTSTQLKSILAAADSLQFETLSDTYIGQWVDASVVSISYKRSSELKNVKFQPIVEGGPAALDQFADLIDATVGTYRWICPVPQANELVCGARKKAFDLIQKEQKN